MAKRSSKLAALNMTQIDAETEGGTGEVYGESDEDEDDDIDEDN